MRAEDLPELAAPQRLRVAGVDLWVCDDPLPGFPYGGNKVRKLAGVLPEALAEGATDLLTFGAVGSHHVLATALYARRVGLRTHVVFIGQPATPHVERQARRNLAHVASWGACGHLAELPAVTARRVAHVVRHHGRVPFRVPPGGSSPAGTVQWVVAGRQLAATLPPHCEVVVAAGSGGTAAGLWAGGCRVRAVRVGPRALVNRRRLRSLGRAAANRLGLAAADPGLLTVDGGFAAGGYGKIDARTRAAWEAGVAAGLAVETTYTAKALAAALVRSEQGEVCFVQTASDRAPDAGGEPLPAAIEALMRGRW